jgi:serine/threonine-protein kinase
MEGVMAGAHPKFGCYILLKEFADDVLGHLYRTVELDEGGVRRTAFLRILNAPQVPAGEVIEAFPLARRLAGKLTAANVAVGTEFVAVDGVPALACDYFSAQPLNVVLDRSRSEDFPVPVDNALLVLEKISLALTAALAVEVDGSALVHGFLHPGLILLSTDGEAVVSGFGLAGSLLGMLGHHDVAQQVHPYLAPEVLLTRTPSKRGDVYSLGALLIELLTGTMVPAEPEERIGLLDRLVLAHDERPLPDDLKALLRRAIAPRPDDRFSSAVDFKKELDRLLYGGSYSPTTFNLALFMDRLFRTEFQAEERERATEATLDVTEYQAHDPEPETVPATAPKSPRRRGRGLRIGGAIALLAAAVIATWWALAGRTSSRPEIPPTPTAEQIAEQRRQEEDRLQAMVQELVQQKMAEKEEEIRQELLDRQARIDDLQRRLRASERRARAAQPSPEELRRQQQLQQQIAVEEEAQRLRQAELGGEDPLGPEAGSPAPVAPDSAAKSDQLEPTTPAPAPTIPPTPTAGPPPIPTPTRVVVVENSFVDPSEVDTLPVVLKDQPVTWSRMALHSRRQGVVIVQVTVNADGEVDQVKVLRADHEGFGIPQAVVDAVRKYRFKPATKAGVRVTSYATVTQRYQFRSR